MAIIKLTNNTVTTMESLDKADRYISDPSKICPNGIICSGCPPSQWAANNRALKRFWRATHKKQLRQIVLGFDPGDNIDQDRAVRIGLKVARLFKGYYVKCAVHNNTRHLHIHILVGNTSYLTGKQLDMSKADLYRFKEECSKILRENGCYGVRMSHRKIEGFPDDIEDSEMLEIADDKYIDAPGEIICAPVEPAYTDTRNNGGYPQFRMYYNYNITNNYFGQPGDYNITHRRGQNPRQYSSQQSNQPQPVNCGYVQRPLLSDTRLIADNQPFIESQAELADDTVVEAESGGFFDKQQFAHQVQLVRVEVKLYGVVIQYQDFSDREQAMAWIMSQFATGEGIRFFIDGILVPFSNGERIVPFIPL